MMENNKIKGILPMVYTQVDDERLFKYNITSKVPMSYLFDRNVTRKIVANCFMNIVKTIVSAEDYMLDINSFVIHMEYIYVNVSTLETELLYLPLVRETDEINMEMFFKNIIFSAKFDQTENCDYVIKLISYLNSGNFSLEKFTKLLEEILGCSTIVNAEEKHTEAVSDNSDRQIINQGTTTVDASVFNNKQSNTEVSSQYSNDNSMKSQSNVIGNPNASNDVINIPNQNINPLPNTNPNINSNQNLSNIKEDKRVKKQREKQQSKKEKKGGLFGKKESKANANISQQPMAIPGVPQPIISNVKADNVTRDQQLSADIRVPGNSVPINADVNKTINAPVIPQAKITQANGNFGETTVLNAAYQNAGETTVLGIGSGQTMFRPYLIRKKNQEKRYIDKETFRIGKENSFVDYFIGDNTAISRSHANIVQNGNDYYIIDVNSKNHTYLNGSIIQSNVEIKLQPGMCIKLADEEFEFNIGS